MKLHVIGAGCPDARPQRYGSAFVLEVAGTFTMIDCGPAATYKMTHLGLRPLQVEHLFFTHHHFDHNVDFACFALSRWDQCIGGEPVLKVIGPPPTAAYVDRLFGEQGAFVDDWKSRIVHPASEWCHEARGGTLPRPAPAFDVREVDEGEVARTDAWTVTAARVQHVEPTLISLAYRFDTPEGSIVFAADCADCPAIRRLAKGAGAIVMACTHFGRTETNGRIVDVITGSPEVAAICNDAGVPRAILTHLSPNYLRPGVIEKAIADIARRYDGEVFFPEEKTTITL